MSEACENKTGDFCWVELMTSDSGAAKQFYEGILGLKPTMDHKLENGHWVEYDIGAGTLAAYANADALPVGDLGPWIAAKRRDPGDYVAFYEINPLVDAWARRYFTFLENAETRGAVVETHLGDARILMQRELDYLGRLIADPCRPQLIDATHRILAIPAGD